MNRIKSDECKKSNEINKKKKNENKTQRRIIKWIKYGRNNEMEWNVNETNRACRVYTIRIVLYLSLLTYKICEMERISIQIPVHFVYWFPYQIIFPNECSISKLLQSLLDFITSISSTCAYSIAIRTTPNATKPNRSERKLHTISYLQAHVIWRLYAKPCIHTCDILENCTSQKFQIEENLVSIIQ